MNLADALHLAERAADAAREQTLSRFRHVHVETKSDGSPVTEADREAERVIREILTSSTPNFPILGEELGGDRSFEKPTWVIDPIDGTIAYSRGLPLFSTLIALVIDGQSQLGLIDLPALGERYVARMGSGCLRNGEPVHVSQRSKLDEALISHGDAYSFDRCQERKAYERMRDEIAMLRGYTDAFGHAQVLSGGVDAMIDLDLNPWDTAASEILIREAGGKVHKRRYGERYGLVIGSPQLVDQLASWLEAGSIEKTK